MHVFSLKNEFIPVLTSAAGSCLTMANWQQTGITTGVFHLDALLMKPGITALMALSELGTYYNWPGKVVLNARLAEPNGQGMYCVRSTYDGELIKISITTLFSLILCLKPDYLILPPDCLSQFAALGLQLPDSVLIFISPEERIQNSEQVVGCYRHFKKNEDFSQWITWFGNLTAPCYVTGDFEREQLKHLARYPRVWVESDLPAEDAMAGRMYEPEGQFNLLDEAFEHQFYPLVKECCCATCAEGFTRAYLHHLLQQTPLLCQRFLIQHNIHMASTASS